MENPFTRLALDTNLLPFDCGDQDLNDFLLNDAKPHLSELLAVTYILDMDNRTACYFSLLNDKIVSSQFGSGKWKQVKKRVPKSKQRKEFPAVKIGRLAVDLEFRKKEEQFTLVS